MRIFDKDATFIADVLAEVSSARQKFPGNAHRWLAAMEELGEAAQAMLDHEAGKTSAEHVYLELVQSAAMVVRLATEGDSSCGWRPEMVINVTSTGD